MGCLAVAEDQVDEMNIRVNFIMSIAALCVLLPPFLPRGAVDLLVFVCIYAIAGLGVGLLLGECGIANLGQTAFYGIGAYAAAYVSIKLHGSPWAGMALGMGVAGLLALLVGWPVLRLTGYFLALATLALGIIASALFYEWAWLTGGDLGIGGIPKIELFGFALDTPVRFFYLALAMLTLCMLLAHNMVTSRTGLMLRSMRDAPDAAISLAINLRWLRTRVFVLSAALGSIAGTLLAHYSGFVNVQSFGIGKTISFLLIPVLGGTKSLWGIVLGSIFITVLPEVLSGFGHIHQILFGLALVLVVVLMPEGLMGGGQALWRRWTATRVDKT
jgi:branched-chain amino acid transport system permease protein